jgi:hypothetical protein
LLDSGLIGELARRYMTTSGNRNAFGLRELLGAADHNRKMSIALLPSWYSAFEEIIIAHNGLMTPGLITGLTGKLGVVFMLTNYAFSYFVAAVDMVFSGQLPACYALLRMCIECIVYAHAIVGSPDLGKVWIRRYDTPSNKTQFKVKFKITNLIDALPTEGIVPSTYVKELYERTVSYGGHPNRDGVLAVGRWIKSERATRIEVGLFTTGKPLLLALKTVAETGYVMTALGGQIFGVQLAPQTLPERIQLLCKQGLPDELARESGSLADITAPGAQDKPLL